MEGLPVIEHEPYRISWSEDERTFYFECSEVREFSPANYILFHDMKTGMKTTFELRETDEAGWLYYAIGDITQTGMTKPTMLLAIKNQ